MNEVVIPILNKEFKVIFSWGSEEEVKKVLKKWKYPMDEILKEHFRGRGVCFQFPGCNPVIALPGLPKTPAEISALSHEAVHAVDYIFEIIGEESCGEVFAYSVGAIVEEVLEEVKKKGKKKNARSTNSNTASKAAI